MATSTESIRIESPKSKFIWHFNPLKALLVVRDFYEKAIITRRDVQIVLIQFAYYSGILPIYFDGTTDRFMIHKSFQGLFCWIVWLIFVTVSMFGLIIAQVAAYRNFVITNILDIVPLLCTAMLTSVWSIHMHTAVKRLDIVQLINGYNQHVQYLKSKTLWLNIVYALLDFSSLRYLKQYTWFMLRYREARWKTNEEWHYRKSLQACHIKYVSTVSLSIISLHIPMRLSLPSFNFTSLYQKGVSVREKTNFPQV